MKQITKVLEASSTSINSWCTSRPTLIPISVLTGNFVEAPVDVLLEIVLENLNDDLTMFVQSFRLPS
jgi:hypothetical protein